MKKLLVLAVVAGCTVEGGKDVPVVAGEGAVVVDPTTQKVTLDAARVPVVEACSAGQVVRRTTSGWECADAAGHTHTLAQLSNAATSEWPGTASWARIPDKPSLFAPEPHTHAAADLLPGTLVGDFTVSGQLTFRQLCDDLGASAPQPALSCRDLHARCPALGDGAYWIDADGASTAAPFQARCDMTTQGGGWTMAFRLDPNDATERNHNNTAFWDPGSDAPVGALDGTSDHLSPAYKLLRGWQSILFDYRYTAGLAKRMAAIYDWYGSGPASSLRDYANITLSNSNPVWQRSWTNNTTAAGWYGPELRNRIVGNDSDYFRFWYNPVNPSICNQGGGVGWVIDGGTSHHGELAFPSTYTAGCQYNVYRTNIGSNGTVLGGTLIAPTDAYDSPVMYVLVR